MSEENSPGTDRNHREDAPTPVTPSPRDDLRRLEMLKLQFEWHKHLTTLTSAGTLLITTVSYTVFRDAAGAPAPYVATCFGINTLLFVTFACFLLVFLWSLGAMRRVIYLVATPGAVSSGIYVQLRYLIPGILLSGGILAFVLFVTTAPSPG